MTVKGNKFEVEAASEFIKCFANPTRLRLLCALSQGGRPQVAEHSVGALAQTAGVSLVSASQQLAILRNDGIVEARRSSQTILYRLANENVSRFIEALALSFCPAERREPDPS